MDELAEKLQQLPLFESLSPEKIAELTKKLEQQRLKKGQTLFHKGDIGDALYIVKKGQIKVVATNQLGEEVVLNQFGPGESFGEMSLIDKQPRSATAIAITSSRMLKLNRDDFLTVVSQDPQFAMEIIRDVSDKLRFAATYIQQATEWSQYIAKGDYNAAMGEIRNSQHSMDVDESDEARADAFLSAFFEMIEGVKEREESLKREVQQLRIEIDETRRAQEVSQILDADYFQDLQKKVKDLKQQIQPEDD